MAPNEHDMPLHDNLIDGESSHDGLGSPSPFDEPVVVEEGLAAAVDEGAGDLDYELDGDDRGSDYVDEGEDVAGDGRDDRPHEEREGSSGYDGDDLGDGGDLDYEDDNDYDDDDVEGGVMARKPRSRGTVFRRVIVLLIVAVLFFCLGEFAANWGWPGLPFGPRTYAGNEVPASESVLRLNEVATWLDRDAIYPIDIDQATQGTVEGLLQSTGDAHATYMDQGFLNEYLAYANGSYAGIGVVIVQMGNYVVVGNVYADTPADQAGVQVGDVVVSIDGDAHQWTNIEVREAIGSHAGSTCDIVWLRPTQESLQELVAAAEADATAAEQDATGTEAVSVVLEGQELRTQVECTDIVIPNVSQQMMGTVGYIALYSFNAHAGDEVADAVTSLQQQGATSLVLDLRGNGGGYVQQAVRIVSLFVPQGDVLQLKQKSGTTTQKVDGNAICDLPLVVLVDQSSASASEIVTAALKDNGRARVVGTVTYGKGTVQAMRLLSYGGAIKYTIAEYLGPNGESINGVGIQPDIEVQAPSDFMLGVSQDDPQLQRALEVARQLAEQAEQAE